METLVSGIVVSLIAGLVGWLTTRSSNKASMTNVATSSRVEMEKEAYERARKMDTETIKRQDEEIAELTTKVKDLNNDVKMVHDENRSVYEENRRLHEENRMVLEDNARVRTEVALLRQRITKVQRGINPDSTAPIRERETDTNPMGDYRRGGE